MENQIPLVAIWMVTYNHERFIKTAIESVINQKTNFQYKLFIGEDFSTDKTGKICEELKKEHPQKIELYRHSKNFGGSKNALFLYEKCFATKAKYIALLEGDDYWVDDYKLQKQVDFLEKNREYSIHSGCVERVDRTNKNTAFTQNRFDFKDFLTSNHLITCTVLFRNNIINYSVLNKKNIFYGDMYLYLCILFKSRGFAYISNEVLSHYRVHSEGFMKSNTTMQHSYNRAIQFWYTKKYLSIPFSDYTKSNFKKINKIYVRVIIDLIVVKRKIEGFKIIYRLLMLVRHNFPLKEMFKAFLKKALKVK